MGDLSKSECSAAAGTGRYPFAQDFHERPSPARHRLLELVSAIAVGARPRLFAAFIAAARARVSVLNFHELEVLLPVGSFFLQRHRAEAHLDPPCAGVVAEARVGHVAKVFAPGDGPSTERAVFDGAQKVSFTTGLHTRAH